MRQAEANGPWVLTNPDWHLGSIGGFATRQYGETDDASWRIMARVTVAQAALPNPK